jgi:hypothetical protein
MRRRAAPWPTRLHRRTTVPTKVPPYPPRGKRARRTTSARSSNSSTSAGSEAAVVHVRYRVSV